MIEKLRMRSVLMLARVRLFRRRANRERHCESMGEYTETGGTLVGQRRGSAQIPYLAPFSGLFEYDSMNRQFPMPRSNSDAFRKICPYGCFVSQRGHLGQHKSRLPHAEIGQFCKSGLGDLFCEIFGRDYWTIADNAHLRGHS